MPEVLPDPRQLPQGSHCVSFHSTRDEAAHNAISFLAGTPAGQAASYWVPDPRTAGQYRQRLAIEFPDHVGCVAVLPHEQVEPVGGRLRPVNEVRAFLHEHPEGVTAAGETLSTYLTADNVPEHLEYESWFQEQPLGDSRFLCPYDLRRIPPDMAPQVLRELGAHHTHVVLSASRDAGVRLLQLFVFWTIDEIPEPLEGTLGWAWKSALVDLEKASRELELTSKGEGVVRDWSTTAVVDW